MILVSIPDRDSGEFRGNSWISPTHRFQFQSLIGIQGNSEASIDPEFSSCLVVSIPDRDSGEFRVKTLFDPKTSRFVSIPDRDSGEFRDFVSKDA